MGKVMRFASICALAFSLTTGCERHPAGQTNPAPGNYTFQMMQYTLNPGAEFNVSELGTLVSSQNSTINLNEGGTESGVIETYDIDNNKYPDSIVLRRASGEIISIGLDYGSPKYEMMKDLLGDRVTLFDPNSK